MFGNKDATLMDALLSFRMHGRSQKARIPRKAANEGWKMPTDMFARKETYFAMARRSRWNQ